METKLLMIKRTKSCLWQFLNNFFKILLIHKTLLNYFVSILTKALVPAYKTVFSHREITSQPQMVRKFLTLFFLMFSFTGKAGGMVGLRSQSQKPSPGHGTSICLQFEVGGRGLYWTESHLLKKIMQFSCWMSLCWKCKWSVSVNWM